MRHIAIVGGIKSGKTSLVDALLEEDPTIHRISMANYGVRIPMTLLSGGLPDLLKLEKSDYIDAILANQNIPLIDLKVTDQDPNKFRRYVRDLYGPAIMAETAIHAMDPKVQNLVDNVASFNDVLFFKFRGFFIAGLYCDFYSKLEGYLGGDRDMYFETKALQLADKLYDTTKISEKRSQQIAKDIFVNAG